MENMVFKFSMSDTYKAVKQYIETGLGLTPEDLENCVKEYAEKRIKDVDLDSIISREVLKSMGNMTYRNGYLSSDGLRSFVERTVREEVKRQVSAVVNAQVKVVLTEINGE